MDLVAVRVGPPAAQVHPQVARLEHRLRRGPGGRAAWRSATRIRASSSSTPNGLVR